MKILMLMLTLLISCSSGQVKESDESIETMPSDFENKKEILEQFEVKEDEEPEPSSLLKQRVDKQKSAPAKKTKSKPGPSAAAASAKSLKPKEDPYPNDYPIHLISLNEEQASLYRDFRPKVRAGETIFMNVSYLGVSTGDIVLSTKKSTRVSGTTVYHFAAHLKTSSYYSYLYEMDDVVQSYVEQKKFVPLKFDLVQRESGKSVNELQLFDLKKLNAYRFYKRVKDGKVKKQESEFFIASRFQDPLSLIYFVRWLPYKKGRVFNVPFYNKGELQQLSVTLLRKEKISTEIGTKQTLVIKASSNYEGKTIKSGDMLLWFSDDESRIFLKFQAKIKIGSVSGEIQKYIP